MIIAPGDMLIALKHMRAWETDDRRGRQGPRIQPGEQALVMATWQVGNQVRLRVLRADRIMVFSNAEHVIPKNWTHLDSVASIPQVEITPGST